MGKSKMFDWGKWFFRVKVWHVGFDTGLYRGDPGWPLFKFDLLDYQPEIDLFTIAEICVLKFSISLYIDLY